MPRFMVQQGCGKLRCIDDGARGLHNAATGSWETIFTTSVDFIGASTAVVLEYIILMYCVRLGEWPEGDRRE